MDALITWMGQYGIGLLWTVLGMLLMGIVFYVATNGGK